MMDRGARLWAEQHKQEWITAHNWEMALVLTLQRAGYSRDQSRRMAEAYRRGDPMLTNDNGGPILDDA
jgi:hypothetical protein